MNDVPEDRRVLQRVPGFVPREDRCQIEAKPVYVHHIDPVMQAVANESPDKGFVGVQGVPGAGIIRISSRRR
jgi:hypothetical protein